jgi:glycosyltransferase involved in cell wall biosynthesis
MNKISAIIITKNEERNIERCLQSLQGVVDEIIVVDSFSTDNTEAICQKYNVKFYQKEWLGYAEQKNYANSLSENDLILSIDADEALSEELKTSILNIRHCEFDLQSPENKGACSLVKTKEMLKQVQHDESHRNLVYQINRLTNYCGKWIYHCGWYPDKKIRIFNRNTAKWTGIVHETLSYSTDSEVILLKGNLHHYSYYSIAEHIAQANKYSTLAAEECFEKNKKYSILVILFKSIWRFKRDYLFKGSFLDGFYGFIICYINAVTTFLKYVKLKQLYKNDKSSKENNRNQRKKIFFYSYSELE